jgi:hypothetical protein
LALRPEKRLTNAAPNAPDNWALYDQFLEMCEAPLEDVGLRRGSNRSIKSALSENSLSGRLRRRGGVVEGSAPTIVVNQLAIMLHDAEFAAWATYRGRGGSTFTRSGTTAVT